MFLSNQFNNNYQYKFGFRHGFEPQVQIYKGSILNKVIQHLFYMYILSFNFLL